MVIKQAVEDIHGLAFGRANRQDAIIAVLVGKPAIEFRAGLAAIVEIDIPASAGPIAGAEELSIG
jgi:hypothetical protein